MTKRICLFVMLFLCLCSMNMDSVIAKKEIGQPIFNEKMMRELQQYGYEWDDLVEASCLAYDFQLPLETVLKLRPDEYDWNQVKKALAQMDYARKTIKVIFIG